MKRPDLRIRVQLTVSVCLFTIVCLISLAVAIYVMSRNTLLNLQRGNLDLNSRLLREECHQEFIDVYNSFFRLSYSSPVKRLYSNYSDSKDTLDTVNLLHESFRPDRILLMNLYLPNGTKILEIDSKNFNRSGIPQSMLPLGQSAPKRNETLALLERSRGHFIGPVRANKPVGGTYYLLSLTLPISDDDPNFGPPVAVNNSTVNSTIGYATFFINCIKLQRILSSVSLTASTKGSGGATLCAARDNFTRFEQLIPLNVNFPQFKNFSSFNDVNKNKPSSQVKQHSMKKSLSSSTTSSLSPSSVIPKIFVDSKAAPNKLLFKLNDTDLIEIPHEMALKLRNNSTPTAMVNKGPGNSMISISPFSVFNSTYYVVVLEDHKGVFTMPHHLRDIIIISSCVIGAGMIIFTFLFVSFGARQILRLKMAATYEQPAPKRWSFLPIPWWLRPSSPKDPLETPDRMHVPEKVPLRKYVRDELDDITERFNTMSDELRKQCARLEERVEARKAEIEQAREAADIANAAKSHFLARVTHELRTPLNGIIGTATLCLEETSIEQIHQSLRTIFKCGELLLHLMTDLLSFSQNEVENLDLELRDFTIPDITSQLTAIFSEQCAAKKIKLKLDFPEENSQIIFRGDTNRILQVIFNLMSNGIKFTPEGGQVCFRTEVEDKDLKYKNVNFFIEDNGPGIAPEMQSRVFEAFVQGDISSQIKKAGVGLGLSICKQLAERMSGTITLKSELGKGSLFIFKVPLEFRLSIEGDSSSPSAHESLDLSTSSSMLRHSHNLQGNNGRLNKVQDSTKTYESDCAPAGTDQLSLNSNQFISTSTSPKSVHQDDDNRYLESPKRSSSTLQRTRGFLSRYKSPENSNSSSAFKLRQRKKSDDSTKRETTKKETNSDNDNTRPTPENLSNRSFSDSSQTSDITSAVVFPQNTQLLVSPNRERDRFTANGENVDSGMDFSMNKDSAINVNSVTNIQPESTEPLGECSATDSSNLASKIHQNLPSPHTLSRVMPDSHNTYTADPVLSRPPLNPSKSYLGRPPSNLKVLVVDDNAVNQEVMMRMLNLEGLHNIKIANDGLDAIAKVKEANAVNSEFDVIFMDVQMPNMDGRQATRVIRSELHLTNVPIVAVSAFANEKNADDCIKAGMNLFLSKPLRRPHLREILRSLTTISASTGPISENASEQTDSIKLKDLSTSG